MKELYLSGLLKNKTINYYREQTTKFDNEGITFPKGQLFYDGALILQNQQQLEILSLREEKQLLNYAHEIHQQTSQKYASKTININNKDYFITDIVDKIIKIILNTNRKFTYILLETLSNILNVNINLKDNLDEYAKLIKYFNTSENLNQIDITLITNIFLKDFEFIENMNLQEEKKKEFLIDENDEAFNDIKDIILLGEFIAPQRLKTIVTDLKSHNPLTNIIAPLYFLIKDPNQAANFLSSCQKENLTIDNLETIATKNKELHLSLNIKDLH